VSLLLALDIGNSNLKLGVFLGRNLLHVFRAPTESASTAEHYALLFREQVALADPAQGHIEHALLASVVPQLTPVVCAALGIAFGCEVSVVGPDYDTGIALSGPDPRELGADRLVNAVAAYDLEQHEAAEGSRSLVGSIVVDLGTATKFDCVAPEGEFWGGIIAPGVQVGLEGLIARAARLRSVELAAPPSVLGRSTVECLQSGLVHGHASLVDGLVTKLRAVLPFPCRVIGTGGLAALIAPHTAELRRLEPALTLHGLSALHARQQALTSRTAAPLPGPSHR
jgi:type III pantothenate kinase